MRFLHRYYDTPREITSTISKEHITAQVREILAADARKGDHKIGPIETWDCDVDLPVLDDDGDPTGETIPLTRFVAEAPIIED